MQQGAQSPARAPVVAQPLPVPAQGGSGMTGKPSSAVQPTEGNKAESKPPLPGAEGGSAASKPLPGTPPAGGSSVASKPLAGPLPAGATVPAQHPPMDATRTPSAEPQPAAVKPGVQFSHFRVGNRNVKDMLADGQYVWVGTSGGVIRYDAKSDNYKLFDVRSGSLLANGVFHVGKLSGNRISVGTYGGGWSIYSTEGEQWKSYNIPQGLADAFVYDVLELPNGDIWVATWSGANRIQAGAIDDRSKWELFTVENTNGGLPNNWVYGLAKGKNGEVWLATEGGLARFQDNQWQHWSHGDGLGAKYEQVKDQGQFANDPGKTSSHHAQQKVEQGLGHVSTAYNPNYIISLEVDAEGVVWCGTWGGGLARFDGSQWRNFTVSDGLPSNYIFMLRQDSRQNLWIGTSKGLARRTADGFVVLNTTDGLFSDNVFSMTFAEDGSLWVGSYGGVARITTPVP
ncbi:MAG: regulator [Magnetococcales bacterium]|nr:regulator [Magnetococcales bacterium]